MESQSDEIKFYNPFFFALFLFAYTIVHTPKFTLFFKHNNVLQGYNNNFSGFLHSNVYPFYPFETHWSAHLECRNCTVAKKVDLHNSQTKFSW